MEARAESRASKSSSQSHGDGEPSSCLARFVEAQEEVKDLVSISAIKASHERDLLEHLDGLLDLARLLNSAWLVKDQGRADEISELQAERKELQQQLSQAKLRNQELELQVRHSNEELAAARERYLSQGSDADERVRRALERERESSEVWKATLLKEARAMIAESIAAERKRIGEAHQASMDAVLQAAEGETSARLAATHETLRRSEEARLQAVRKAGEANERLKQVEAEASALRQKLAHAEKQAEALRIEASSALGRAAEEQERGRQLSHMLSLSRQGHEEFVRVVEQRHAEALRSKDASLEAQLDAFNAATSKEVEALRQRSEAVVRDRDDKVIEWRSRYYECLRKLEAEQDKFTRLTRDLDRLGLHSNQEASNSGGAGTAAPALLSTVVSPAPSPGPASASFVSP